MYPRLFPIPNLGQNIQSRLGKSLGKNEKEAKAHECTTTCCGISGGRQVLSTTTSVRTFRYHVQAYAFRRSSVTGQERCLQNDTYRDILCKGNYTWVASCLREHIQNAVRWSDIQEYVKTGGPATCLSVRRLRGHCQQGVKSGLPVKI